MSVVEEFLDYLRRSAIPAPYLSTYERHARRFLAAFPQVLPERFGNAEIHAFLSHERDAGATEQELRDLEVVADAVVWFLHHRHRASVRPPGTPSTRPERFDQRVEFIRDVTVAGLGSCRSSDLSSRGIFVETLANVAVGVVLELAFRIEPTDPAPTVVRARVAYHHPQLGVGFSFLSVPPETQLRIDHYVQQHAPPV